MVLQYAKHVESLLNFVYYSLCYLDYVHKQYSSKIEASVLSSINI